MEENTMTAEQVLVETVKILGGIQLPVSMDQAISQIRGAMSNIQMCINAYARVRELQGQVTAQEELDMEVGGGNNGNVDNE